MALRSLLLDSNAGVVAESRALLAAAWAQTNSGYLTTDGLTRVDETRSAAVAVTTRRQALAPGRWRTGPKTCSGPELRGAVISKSGEVTWL